MPTGVPSPPLNCTVSNQTWESVEVTCGDSGASLGHHRGHSYGYNNPELNEVAPANHPAELLQDSDKPRYLLTVKERLTHAVTHNLTGKKGGMESEGREVGGRNEKSPKRLFIRKVNTKIIFQIYKTIDL